MKDKQIEALIKKEAARQKSVINLIASENIVSPDVLTALGSVFTNKYSEGYSGRRYYGGNEIVDQVENLCIERALKLFGLSKNKWAVNVQALSGSPANLAVYTALIPTNGTGKIMGMSLANGGHLTHGHKVSATGIFFKQVPFGVDQKTEMLDYEALKNLAVKEMPDIIVAGFTAYPRQIDFKKFREIADASSEARTKKSGNKKLPATILMVDMSHIAGLIAGKAYPSPFEYADVVTTTIHKGLRGPRSAVIYSRLDKSLEKEVSVKDKKTGKSIKTIKSFPISELIDKAVFPGLQGGPHNNQIAAVAVALKEAADPAFKTYAKQVKKNATVLANELAKAGWKIISGGTDSHLILVDVWNNGIKNENGAGGLSGKEAESRLEKAGIIVNKNAIPFDTRSPFDPSGIRLGTYAETTRGKKEADFKKIAEKIDKILKK